MLECGSKDSLTYQPQPISLNTHSW